MNVIYPAQVEYLVNYSGKDGRFGILTEHLETLGPREIIRGFMLFTHHDFRTIVGLCADQMMDYDRDLTSQPCLDYATPRIVISNPTSGILARVSPLNWFQRREFQRILPGLFESYYQSYMVENERKRNERFR